MGRGGGVTMENPPFSISYYRGGQNDIEDK